MGATEHTLTWLVPLEGVELFEQKGEAPFYPGLPFVLAVSDSPIASPERGPDLSVLQWTPDCDPETGEDRGESPVRWIFLKDGSLFRSPWVFCIRPLAQPVWNNCCGTPRRGGTSNAGSLFGPPPPGAGLCPERCVLDVELLGACRRHRRGSAISKPE